MQTLQPFSFTYLNPGTLKSFLRPSLARGVCSPGIVWVQIGVFLCSARNNLLCGTLQGLGFVAARVQVGCLKCFTRGNSSVLTAWIAGRWNFHGASAPKAWTSTWGGLVLSVRKLLFSAQYSVGLLTQRPGGKWLNLVFTRDIFDEVFQFSYHFFFFPGWDGMGKKKSEELDKKKMKYFKNISAEEKEWRSEM